MVRALAITALALAAAAHWCAADSQGDRATALGLLQSRGEDSYTRELLDLVAIPSVSSLPEHLPDLLRAAHWLADRLRAAGLEHVAVLPTSGPRPVVYADFLHAPGAPTALIYGHYDVQPASSDDLPPWHSPPFAPEVRDGRVWGRGASDDKGSGVLPPIQAVEAILKSSGSLPLNIKFFLEGEEEIGSPFLEPFLEQNKQRLACDFVVSADGGQISETEPSLSLGLRGAVAVEVEVVTAATDVHSGLAGGAVQNPARALAQLLATMWHPGNSSVAIQGFYDRVLPITDADRRDMAALGFDEAAELLDPLGVSQGYGEAGFTALERLWHRPTLEVVGLGGGFGGQGIKTIVPRRAFAKLAARLVPDQTPGEIAALIRAHVEAYAPPACNVSVTPLGFSARPYSQPKLSMPNRAAAKASGLVLTRLMGNAPKYVRSGATIPALAAFQHHLGATTTVFAFGLPDSNMHAPNEQFPLSMYRLARRAWVELLFELPQAAAAEAQTAARNAAHMQGEATAEHSEL